MLLWGGVWGLYKETNAFRKHWNLTVTSSIYWFKRQKREACVSTWFKEREICAPSVVSCTMSYIAPNELSEANIHKPGTQCNTFNTSNGKRRHFYFLKLPKFVKFKVSAMLNCQKFAKLIHRSIFHDFVFVPPNFKTIFIKVRSLQTNLGFLSVTPHIRDIIIRKLNCTSYTVLYPKQT